jgi:hypothetical protein
LPKYAVPVYKSRSGSAYAALGFDVVNKNTISIYPFAGVGVNFFGPNEKYEKNHSELNIKETDLFSYIVGINFDYKIIKTSSSGGYMPVRLAITYGIPAKPVEQISGNFFNISLGVSFIARGVVRKK